MMDERQRERARLKWPRSAAPIRARGMEPAALQRPNTCQRPTLHSTLRKNLLLPWGCPHMSITTTAVQHVHSRAKNVVAAQYPKEAGWDYSPIKTATLELTLLASPQGQDALRFCTRHQHSARCEYCNESVQYGS